MSEETPTPLEIAIKKRDIIHGKLVAVANKIAGWDTATVNIIHIELLIKHLEELRNDVNKNHEEITLLTTDKEFKKDHAKLFESYYHTIEVHSVNLIGIQRQRATASKAAFKFEKIKIPKFSGEVSEWQSFRDLFITAIHNNQELTPIEKITHLKTSIVGPAAKIIASYQPIAANYNLAWAAIKERYENIHELIFAHIKKLDECKPLQFESAIGLRNLSDSLKDCVRSLKVSGVPIQDNDVFPIYIILKKLDPETRKHWTLQLTSNLPKHDELAKFLEDRARALANSTKSKSEFVEKKKTSSHHTSNSSSSSTPRSCVKCSQPHFLNQCKSFQNLPTNDRKQLVIQNHLCFNCFSPTHSSLNCKSRFSCRKCNKKHHTLLHFENSSKSTPMSSSNVNSSSSSAHTADENSQDSSSVVQSLCTQQPSNSNIALLGTLLVHAKDSFGEKRLCRVFVDQGSESTFITERCVNMLGLKRKKTCVVFTGTGDSATQSANGEVSFTLYSRFSDFNINISALILRKVTNPMPSSKVRAHWSHLKSLQLGDPNYHVPGHVDILLGVSYVLPIMLPGIIHGPEGAPHGQQTQFGWMLTGSIKPSLFSNMKTNSYHVSCQNSNQCLQDSLKQFWEIEDADSSIKSQSREELECESHFISTHHRNSDGTYTVELPFKIQSSTLGESRQAAVQRFLKVENRLKAKPEIKADYVNQMKEYQANGFMELIPDEEIKKENHQCYYMPHREVIKSSSSTTKCRIVYDASAKSSNGVSLNDALLTGPKLQTDLVPLLIKFRSHEIAISADIIKFYPQFKVNKKHIDYQRLVWRENPHQQLKDYRMLRVTFGITSAPYLAIRCLHQLAEDEKLDFPSVSKLIKSDFLVDNLLTGSNDVKSALSLQQDIIQVMERGKLKLVKWASNSEEVLQAVKPEERECQVPLSIDENESIKTIGILWNPGNDTFGISISTPQHQHQATKRKVLSSIARIFDPLGWLSPVTIKSKILMQEIWKLKLDWDSLLTPQIQQQWSSYCEELHLLKEFKLRRCLVNSTSLNQSVEYELHGFSDASKLAYAACVYVKCISVENQQSIITLVAAKTKVAPIKSQSIPRLELCGAVLLSRLMKIVAESTTIEFKSFNCWTDSQIVLDWLKSSKALEVFVNNRVKKIQNLLPTANWLHVDTKSNPADSASRGIPASKLINNQLWVHGPEWLKVHKNQETTISSSYATREEKDIHSVSSFIENCSSFTKMRRVICYCLRFLSKKENRKTGFVSASEMQKATTKIVFIIQQQSFTEEIKQCKSESKIKSNIKFLSPFLDSNGILRVGGRIENSNQPFEAKHPVLIPYKHPFTDVLVRFYHLKYLHAGPTLLLSILRQEYWIVRGKDAIRKIISKCVVCHRQSATTNQQLMGQLPSARVNQAKPFSQCGLDYAGPFMINARPGRKPQVLKSYVCLFVCMVTKAIHLEWVGDLTTAAFLAALNRFVSRRGLPADIYCDGGRNFLGAKKEIEEIVKFINSSEYQETVSEFSSVNNIKFHINPPFAPHHGGLWEAGVKSMKLHLKRVVENRRPTIEEFITLLTQIEACLNSRPLTPMSTDPNDYEALTPGHFLVGSSLAAVPQHDLSSLNSNILTRWQSVQQMTQHFWKRWQMEYLNLLQSRPKWLENQPNISPGVMVLVRDDDLAWGPQKWKLGRVATVYPGADGRVRVCDVTTSNGSTYRRPIVKLSVLPIY